MSKTEREIEYENAFINCGLGKQEQCKCDQPYSYAESLRDASKGKLMAVAPMFSMDTCMKCFGEIK